MRLELYTKGLANKKRDRLGRGRSSGSGKTSTRGTKGQRSRAGSGYRKGLEGGQMKLFMRLPKRPGFRSMKQKPEVFSVRKLALIFGDQKITKSRLLDRGLIKSQDQKVKVVGNLEKTPLQLSKAISISKKYLKR